MKRDEILKAIKGLAQSQGSYGRMLASIEEMDEESKEQLFDMLEAQNFDDTVDLVMFLEG